MANENQEAPRVETRKQQGSYTVLRGGKKQVIPITLTITDTYYADGRKDCTISVPRLGIKAKKGEQK